MSIAGTIRPEPKFADKRGRRRVSDAQLVAHFESRIRRLSRSHSLEHMPAIDHEDLQQNAVLAMLRVIKRYNPATQVPFGAYVGQRLHGAILDTVRVEARQSKRDRIGRLPGEEPDNMDSLPSQGVYQNGEDAARQAKLLEFLNAAARECLTTRQRFALSLLYFHGLTMKRAGRRLGVGESRMSQIHAEIMGELKQHLALRGYRKLADIGI